MIRIIELKLQHYIIFSVSLDELMEKEDDSLPYNKMIVDFKRMLSNVDYLVTYIGVHFDEEFNFTLQYLNNRFLNLTPFMNKYQEKLIEISDKLLEEKRGLISTDKLGIL